MKNAWGKAAFALWVAVLAAASAFAAGQTAESPGANTQDPRAILRATQHAVGALQTLTYDAVSRGEAGLATNSIVKGHVAFSRLGANDPLMARMAVHGVFFPAGSGKGSEFQTAFDGTTIYKLIPKDQRLLKRTLAEGNPEEHSLVFVTSFFGGGSYNLILFPLITPGQFVRRAGWPVVVYDGRTMVSGVLCQVIYAENKSRTLREWWYIGVEDDLPREVESVGADAEGRWGANALILSNLQPNSSLARSAFQIALPAGFSVKVLEQYKPPSLLPVGSPAPDWKLEGPAGHMHTLAQYRGKVVVMDFGGTWCTPCVRSLPGLERIYEKYSGKGVALFWVDSWEPSNAEAYVRERGYKFPLLLKGETIAKAYHVDAVPTVYVIGTRGRVVYAGEASEQRISAVLESYLKTHEGRQ